MIHELQSTVMDVMWVAILGLAASVVALVAARCRDTAREMLIDRLLVIWLIAVLLTAAYLTLAGPMEGRPGSNLNPLAPIDARNALGNVLLFAPVGFLAVLVGRSRSTPVVFAVILTAAASVTIEIIQFVAPVGRSGDIQDVALNTAGGLLGALSAAGLLQITRRFDRSDSEERSRAKSANR